MVLDFIFIFLIIFSLFVGYRKGFTQMLLSCAVFLFSIVLVAGIYNYLGDFFLQSEYGEALLNDAAKGMGEYVSNFETSIETQVPFLSGLINTDNTSGNVIAQSLAEKAIKSLMTIPLLIVSFVLLKLLVFLVRSIVTKTTTLPVVGTVDSLLGSICGLMVGILVVSVLYFILGYIQILPSMAFIKEQFDSSFIVILINDIF